MKHINRVSAGLAVTLTSLTAVALSQGQAQPTIGAVLFSRDSFFQGIQNGMKAAADKLGVKLLISIHEHDPAKEAEFVSTYVAQKVNALVITPESVDASVATVKAAADAKIPVICYNTCLNDKAAAQYVKASVQTDQLALGRQTGAYARKYIVEKLGGKAIIGILNCDRFEACKQRKAGFQKALAGLPGVKFVADQEGFEADKAATVAENVLQAHPEINVLWAANEGGTVGEVVSVRSRNLSGKVVVFGTDISSQLAQFLLDKDNILQAVTGQSPEAMGALAVQNAVKAIKGEAIRPFTQLTANAFYSRADPVKVNSFLKQ